MNKIMEGIIFGILLIAICSNPASGRTTEPITTESTTEKPIIVIRPPFPPFCILPPVCPARSPRVCGRSPDGDCQRFNNICELIRENRRGLPIRVYHTRDLDCRGIKAVGVAHRRACYRPCPNRPVVCKRTPPEMEICVQSRNLKSCKVLANRCQMHNQNCHSRPRNNWHRTDKRHCGERQVGDKPAVCEKLPAPVTLAPKTTRKPT